MNKEQIASWFQNLQDSICLQLQELDGEKEFKEDQWERPGGGGGKSRVIAEGKVIEKGGVNFSIVFGPTPEKILKKLNLPEANFYATGISIVLHPQNPYVPIIHMNLRYFEMTNGIYWFGGGIDVTPHYFNRANAIYFHQYLRQTCTRHHHDYYDKFKNWADDYFYIRHRKETRGIGGIFFDQLKENEHLSKEEIFAFVKDIGLAFYPIYKELVISNKDKTYGEDERKWQALRRGRYVEFNLVWDKGTKFGLDTNGRTESILMSLPPMANWAYSYQPPEGSAEHEMQQWLKKDINWLKV
jgi:coproporphyrinogen III oxidase